MSKNITFSIIIPTFNSEKVISNAIDSILCQTFNNYEIVIMDGKSADRSIEILNTYCNSKIKITSEKDRGIYDAMNKAIKVASGEWILFLGSDDTLYSRDVLLNINKLIQTTKYKVIYGNVFIVGDVRWAKDNTVYDGEFSLKKLVKKNICHQSIFYRREILVSRPFNLNYKTCADYDLNIYLWSKYKFQYTPTIISKFNAGGQSSTTNDTIFYNDFDDNLKRYFKLWFLNTNLPYIDRAIKFCRSSINRLTKRLYLQ